MPTVEERAICEGFYALSLLAEATGDALPLNKHDGCWEHQIDEQWWCAVNGHKEEMECSHGGKVPSYSALIEFNGWPAGIIDPFGGIVAAGTVANEDSFIAAVEAATASFAEPSDDR